jgi:cell division protein FtsI (penicillin-binding protein 3)
LASVSLPANNPNDRSLSSWQIKNSKNRVVEDVFEPGSTVKPFVVALALDEEQVKSDEKINTSPGSIRVQGNRITDDRDKGVLSVGEILEKSSNVGMVKISKRLTSKSMWNMYQKLGFTQLSGTFLPGESSGYMKEWQEWQPIDQAAASYGYSISANILQLARAYTVFANDGKILPISLRKKDMSLKEHHEQVFSAKTANLVLKMMERVVNKGTAPLARIPGYRVAGKTGTSHINLKDRKGYENNEYNSFFAGIVPASDPKFIMITMANKPSLGVYFGGEIAGPVFSKVMKQALRLYNISPDK